MGRYGLPVYGEDLGSAIEDAEKLIAKIKTNKYDKTDLINLSKCFVEIITAVSNDEV